MDINTCIKLANYLKESNEIEDYGLDALVVRICEIYKKHMDMNDENINDMERFILGLRYCEFFANDNTDEELM